MVRQPDNHGSDDCYLLQAGEAPASRIISFRAFGCYPLTAGVGSDAAAIKEVTELKLSE